MIAKQPAKAPQQPEVTTCEACSSSAHYVGTQERVRYYVCDNNPQHLRSFPPGAPIPEPPAPPSATRPEPPRA